MTFATLAIGAACWFGPAWICGCPARMNAAWPYAGHTVLDDAAPATPSCALRRASMGRAAVEEGARNCRPRAAAMVAKATSRPAVRSRGFRRVVVRVGWWWVMPPFNAAWCCRDVRTFRYAGDMRPLVGWMRARADRRGRALHGGSHPRWPAPGSDRSRHRG